jgi:putative ABC transport system ATP-binding protein
MKLLLKAEGLTKTYHRGPERVHALQHVSFGLPVGQIIALMGPSGSGKTTVMNLVAGWEEPDEGTITWAEPIADPPPWEVVAIVPQSLGLIEELSVLENVEMPARLADRLDEWHRGRARELVGRLGLDGVADRAPAEVSLGEQQRTAIGRTLLLGPRLLLADEPTGHQDAGWEQVIFELLSEAAVGGTTSFVATHNHDVLKYVDRLLAIRDGEIT